MLSSHRPCVCVAAVRTWLGAVCDWLDSSTDPAQSSFVTQIGPAELVASSVTCPWSVRARRGQRLNLTVNFASLTAADDDHTDAAARETASSLCSLVIHVVDGGRTTTLKPPCGRAKHRQRQTYSSMSNELKVYVHSTGGSTYSAAAVPASAAVSSDDDDDDTASSTSSPVFLLHYHSACHSLVDSFTAVSAFSLKTFYDKTAFVTVIHLCQYCKYSTLCSIGLWGLAALQSVLLSVCPSIHLFALRSGRVCSGLFLF